MSFGSPEFLLTRRLLQVLLRRHAAQVNGTCLLCSQRAGPVALPWAVLLTDNLIGPLGDFRLRCHLAGKAPDRA